MKKLLFLSLFLLACILPSTKSFSQVSSIKLNVPALLGGVINPEIEMAISPSMSMNVAIIAYPWGKMPLVGNHLLHFTVQPGVRYWFQGVHTGVFMGTHATMSYMEVALGGKDHRAAGLGLGLSAGYAWMLSPRWNLELEVGGSVMHLRFDVRTIGESYTGRLEASQTLFLPTKAALNIVYLF